MFIQIYRLLYFHKRTAALKGDYRLRTVVGWLGALEKLNIFEAELDEFAIGYLKKLIFEKEKPDAAFFEECDDGKMFFHLLRRDREDVYARISFTEEMYEKACNLVRREHLPENHRSHFVDMNVADSIETEGENDGKQ